MAYIKERGNNNYFVRVTYLLSNGCDIKTVSKRLGHTSIDTTNIMVETVFPFSRIIFQPK